MRHLIVLPSFLLRDVPVEVIAPEGLTVSYAPSGSLLVHLHRQPVILVAAVIVVQHDLIRVGDDQIKVTVAVQVGGGAGSDIRRRRVNYKFGQRESRCRCPPIQLETGITPGDQIWMRVAVKIADKRARDRNFGNLRDVERFDVAGIGSPGPDEVRSRRCA